MLSRNPAETGRKPLHAHYTHSWCLKPDNHQPSCPPPITFSTGPGEGKVARNNTEKREKECWEGEIQEAQERVLKVRGRHWVEETERDREEKRGGRSEETRAKLVRHA